MTRNPHNSRADKNPYPHNRRADKDSYLHDSSKQCIILRLQLSFMMINVQLMVGSIDFILFFDICSILQQIHVNIILFICAYNYVEDSQILFICAYNYVEDSQMI